MDWEKFSKEELQDAINRFVDKITVRFDHEKTEHIVTIKFKLPLVDDNFHYKDPDNKSKGYSVTKGNMDLEGKLPSVKKGRPSKNTHLHHHSTVSFVRCGWVIPITDNDLHFTFDLITRSSSLNHQYYSEYQHFLYNTITDLLDKGLNYQEIADWLNEKGYTTTRGKKFRNSHTHSIIKKKKSSDIRYNITYPSQISGCSLEMVDKTIINSE